MVPAPMLAPRADAGVADVAEVVGLGAFLDDGVLDLDEVADVRVLGDLGAGAQPGEGADAGAAADVAALEVAEGEDRRAPDSTVTSGPKTTFGPIITSRPITVSRANQTVAGSVSVAPFAIASARARAWKAASAAARSARELTPSVSASGQVMAAAR